MAVAARLRAGETLGDRIIKVDHAGEHGAVCIYRAQRWLARWRAPEMVPELDRFLAHERGHRARFAEELERRRQRRCRSFSWCGFGGFVLGALTGVAGRSAIAATTVAIERVVLRHMHEQVDALEGVDEAAVRALRQTIAEEQEHHDVSLARVSSRGIWAAIVNPVVRLSTHAVIWLGMRL